MRDSTAQRKGVTLFELLAVIFILGIVFSIAYRGARKGIDSFQERRIRFEVWNTGRTFLWRMARELRCTFPASFEEGEGRRVNLLEGSGDRIRFVSTVSSPRALKPDRPALGQIEYFIQRRTDGGGQVLRKRVQTLEKSIVSDRLEEGIVGLRLLYWHPDGGWVGEWGSNMRSLPRSVKVTIEVKGGKQNTQKRFFSTVVHLPASRRNEWYSESK